MCLRSDKIHHRDMIFAFKCTNRHVTISANCMFVIGKQKLHEIPNQRTLGPMYDESF